MLLSQKITADKKFIDINYARLVGLNSYSIRKSVMGAVKLVVPDDILDISKIIDGKARDLNVSSIVQELSSEKLKERCSLYVEFSRLPFDSIFMENTKCGVLVEKYGDNGFIVTGVSESGALLIAQPIFIRVPVGDYPFTVTASMSELVASDEIMSGEILGILSNSVVMAVCEILLFLNVKNNKIKTYTPTKRELPPEVTKNKLPLYQYKILDIYRDRDSFKSLADLSDFTLSAKRGGSQKRSHLVRGHFKRMKNGLFWWNPFVRCRKNKDTVGVIEKDYRLN